MQEVETVFKNVDIKTYGGPSYKGVSHDDVAKLLHLPLAKQGIVAVSSMDNHELTEGVTSNGNKVYISNVWASVELINADDPSERIRTQSFAMGFDSQDKGAGKAYSMAIKYCFLKLFMLESADNEEERVQDSVSYKPSNKQNAGKFDNTGKPYDWQWNKLNDLCVEHGIDKDKLRPKISKFNGNDLYKLTGHIMKNKRLPDELC